ncbi:hypothetical protein EDD37DRAFT_452411 [Exophiala viscosa]|uniref:uncharacterized protein n=1 Tax=Exophiala viscosa TaxID=2486360 RepID=UPI00218DC255|nr:hypothetical protein EDD37DRAFT_452411 [Exophiala viscosa]
MWPSTVHPGSFPASTFWVITVQWSLSTPPREFNSAACSGQWTPRRPRKETSCSSGCKTKQLITLWLILFQTPPDKSLTTMVRWLPQSQSPCSRTINQTKTARA